MSDTLQHSFNSQENSHQMDKVPSLAGVKVRSFPEHTISEPDQELPESLQMESLAIERSTDPKIQVKNIYSFIEKTVTAPHIIALLKQISKSQFRSVRRFISSGPGAPILSLIESKNNILNKSDESSFFASADTNANPLEILNKMVKETAKIFKTQNFEDLFGIQVHSVPEANSRNTALYVALHEASAINSDLYTIANNLLSEMIIEYRRNSNSEEPVTKMVGASENSLENTSTEVAVIGESIPSSSVYFVRESPRDEKQQEIQPWLDQGREEDFKKVTQFFSELYELDKHRVPFQQWLVNQFNLALPEEKKLELKDMSSVVLRVVKAIGAGEVAGQEIERPVITFLDRRQYFDFMERVSEGSIGSALYMQFIGDENNIFVRTGLIFASRLNDMEFAHEIRHTIDPHVKTRIGVNQIMTEAFAFFQANHEDKDAYVKLLTHYYDDFGKKENGEMVLKDEFNSLVGKVVEKILVISNKSDPLSAQRQLVQCKTIDELLTL